MIWTDKRQRRGRRGSTATYFAVMLPALGMFSALGIEIAYLGVVQQQLQGVSDAAAHGASLVMDGSLEGLDLARAEAKLVTDGSVVNFVEFELQDEDVIFGFYDTETLTFVESDDPDLINSVKVPLTEEDVGLGFGMAFFNKVFPVSSCAAVMQGPGNANTGDLGGNGLKNGHFDYDTSIAAAQCPGSDTCEGTFNHSHEFDDNNDVTYTDVFSDLEGHFPIDGCVDLTGKKPKAGACGGDFTRNIPDGTPFKIIVANADLSPGAWITINGEEFDVDFYDDLAFGSLPTYVLGGVGANSLTSLTVNFDVNAIANCELIPTQTGDVRKNTPGINGEWRSGALTVQYVDVNATTTSFLSSGDHDVVINEDNGLFYEATYFWHWDGPAYTASDATAWQELYDDLDCHSARFIDHVPGGTTCAG